MSRPQEEETFQKMFREVFMKHSSRNGVLILSRWLFISLMLQVTVKTFALMEVIVTLKDLLMATKFRIRWKSSLGERLISLL